LVEDSGIEPLPS